MRKRPSEIEQLISDYNKDNRYIARQAMHWCTPRKKEVCPVPAVSNLEQLKQKIKTV